MVVTISTTSTSRSFSNCCLAISAAINAPLRPNPSLSNIQSQQLYMHALYSSWMLTCNVPLTDQIVILLFHKFLASKLTTQLCHEETDKPPISYTRNVLYPYASLPINTGKSIQYSTIYIYVLLHASA